VKRYLVEAVPAAKLEDPLVGRCDGFDCHRYTAHDDLCRARLDKAFLYSWEPPDHFIDAWDDDEAIRIAACWITAEHGDSALGRVREWPHGGYIAYLQGSQQVAS